MKKTLSFEIPEYLTIDQYTKINLHKDDNKLEQILNTLVALTDYSKEEVSKWSIKSLKEVYTKYAELGNYNNEFHSIIEWNGQLLGYSDIKSMNLGCYVDLENLSNDMDNNLHKIAALLYRPIKKHRFDSLKFTVKQKIKMLNNSVENVFDWYELEEYDSSKRKDVEESFKQFPVHILLGALSFFLGTASLYLTNTAYSEELMSKNTRIVAEKSLMENLSQNIMAGGGLFTHSVSPIYLQFPAISLS